MRYWVSWYDTDSRPHGRVQVNGKWVNPIKEILGSWESGIDLSNDNVIVCALIQSKSEPEAISLVKKYWEPIGEFRFCEGHGDNWLPGDRFPLEE
jgi:hypothetical protein